MTQAERLTRIETLLEGMAENRADERQSAHAEREAMVKKIEEMADDVKAIRKDVEADKAELAALKNKGAGILIGVGLFGGGIGAAFAAGISKLTEVFQ